ncbi:MAG: helix-turn-helix domain-containing protein [Pseudomonadota bacterium]
MTDAADVMEGWYDEETATFGDRMSAAREQAGLSQVQLAKQLGVKHGTIRNWEDDISEPRANKLQMMAGLVGVSLSWLLTGEGEGPDGPPDEDMLSTDVTDVLVEIRVLKGELSHAVQRLGYLEKKLRQKLKES